MHYAILNSSGNALGWFTDEEEARRALAEMTGDSSDADLDLVAFEGPGRPVEPVSASARSAWPAARLVWSTQTSSGNYGDIDWSAVIVTSAQLAARGDNATDDRVIPVEA